MSILRVDHVGIWTGDLEGMRDFYVTYLGGSCGPLYENPRKGFRSYFISFAEGARLELMSRAQGYPSSKPGAEAAGYAHVAYRVGSREAVDALTARLQAAGISVVDGPRVTGDGYYEVVIVDPEGNRVEIVE